MSGHGSAAAALGLGPRELVAIVGSGGKTSLLRLLARELAGGGSTVTVTTTTAMYLSQLADLGPMQIHEDLDRLLDRLRDSFVGRKVVGAARGLSSGEKVVGLPGAWVDSIWAAELSSHVVVEADGSQHKSLKAFAPHEPVVPTETTTIVQVAGLDILGKPLGPEFVHRAEVLSRSLGVSMGSPVTATVVTDCLLEQLRVLRAGWPSARVVTVLNKADDPLSEAAGSEVAAGLSAVTGGPDEVVISSCTEGRFRRVRAPFVSAIVLAAGRAERMGEQKLLLPLKGRSLVRWVVDAAVGSRADETIVVVGHEAREVASELEGLPVSIVVNREYSEGMSTSLKTGVGATNSGRDAVVFLLGDQPLVSSAVVDRLIDAFVRSGRSIVRPLVDGRPAHPVLMSATLIPEIMSEEGDRGAREVLERRRHDVFYVAVDDPRIDLDVDSREDYESLLGSRRSGPGSRENG